MLWSHLTHFVSYKNTAVVVNPFNEFISITNIYILLLWSLLRMAWWVHLQETGSTLIGIDYVELECSVKLANINIKRIGKYHRHPI